jgi:hypothetical protein
VFCKNSVRWLYRLEESYSWESGHRLEEDVVFLDKSGAVRLVIERGGRITVTRGYAWDGCTPKVCLFDILIGVPDGVVHARTGRPKTYYASLVHDALYQFLPDGLPLTRYHADEFFLRLMAESDFGPRRIYWLAVRTFGGLFRSAARQVRKTRGTAQSLAPLLR